MTVEIFHDSGGYDGFILRQSYCTKRTVCPAYIKEESNSLGHSWVSCLNSLVSLPLTTTHTLSRINIKRWELYRKLDKTE